MPGRWYEHPNFTANSRNERWNTFHSYASSCDLEIQVRGERYWTHKDILASNLEYFKITQMGGVFRKANIDPQGMMRILDYAYYGKIKLTEDNALACLEAANYFREDGIKRACIDILGEHLKLEESLRAYKLAKSIRCISLKNVAKTKLLFNFANLLMSTEYRDLDHESLIDILSDGKGQPDESQQFFFEGILKRILHDASNRRTRLKDLINSMDMTKLTTGYLKKYVKNIEDHYADEDSAMVAKDLMSYYRTHRESAPTTENQAEHAEQTLVIISGNSEGYSFRFREISRNGWSEPQTIQDTGKYVDLYNSAVLNDKFYFIYNEDLSTLDLSTKLFTFLSPLGGPMPVVLKSAAVCACSRFVYLCGGFGSIIEWQNVNTADNRVLRYDPRTNVIVRLPPMRFERDNAVAVFYRDCLYVLGGFNRRTPCDKVEKYNTITEKWMELPPMEEIHTAHAVAVLNGKLYVCGGQSIDESDRSVAVFDPTDNSWQLVAEMNESRLNLKLIAYNGKLLAIGGDEKATCEEYDPSTNQWEMKKIVLSGEYSSGGLFTSRRFTSNVKGEKMPSHCDDDQ